LKRTKNKFKPHEEYLFQKHALEMDVLALKEKCPAQKVLDLLELYK